MRNLILAVPAALAVIAASIWLSPVRGHLLVGGVNILPWILPSVLTMALVEGVVLSLRAGARDNNDYDWKAWFASAGDAMVRQFVNLLPLSLVGPAFALAWQHRLATIPLNGVGSFVVLLVGQEFCYYWLHRASHRVRWFWATHAVHHSPNDYTLAAAYRLGWTAKLSGEAVFNLPLIWFGFRPDVVAATLLFNLLYQFWLHTELVPRLGWLELVLNTPSHHRSNPAYLDRNFGGVLIVFDRLFDTAVTERRDEPCRYGLTKKVTSYNPAVIAMHEWGAMLRDVARARSWRERFLYVFGPPGWAP
jgi:sterol desaturase/sphingolipid hydroxylase (fatty acid hydroxylase superfamily)